MAGIKYSKQREVIKDYLCSTKEHPTADTVYMHVREEFPKISLGTVYRNLNLLVDIGEAIKILTPDGGVRFDATTAPHYHALCTECDSVSDLDMDIQDSLLEEAQKCFSGTLSSYTALFYGVCEDCKKKHIDLYQ